MPLSYRGTHAETPPTTLRFSPSPVIMRLVALALLLAASATAQTSLADGAGPFLSVERLDVLGGDGGLGADVSAGWRFGSGTDVEVALDATRDQGLETTLRLGATLGHTWEVAPRVGTWLAASAGFARLSEARDGPARSFDGATVGAEAVGFYRLPLLGRLALQPTAGVFFHTALVSGEPSARALPLAMSDAVGAVVRLPLALRVGEVDLALSPTVRLGLDAETHAFISDGGMRLRVNL